jgi:hypothetical protein
MVHVRLSFWRNIGAGDDLTYLPSGLIWPSGLVKVRAQKHVPIDRTVTGWFNRASDMDGAIEDALANAGIRYSTSVHEQKER